MPLAFTLIGASVLKKTINFGGGQGCRLLQYLNSFREFRIPFAIHPNRLCGISLVEVSLSVVQRQNSKSFLASQQSASWLGYFTSLRQYCIIPSIIASSLLLGRESVTFFLALSSFSMCSREIILFIFRISRLFRSALVFCVDYLHISSHFLFCDSPIARYFLVLSSHL